MRILSVPPTLKMETIISEILSDEVLESKTKESLLEYTTSDELIVELNVTFAEVLNAVWNRIIINPNATSIKQVLNSEMEDAFCMCFTGKISRLVNCLSEFDEFVVVKIADNDQIGNVIYSSQRQLEREGRYTIELHKEMAINALRNLGYTDEIIQNWVQYITEEELEDL
jgi:hypothetical protein